MAQPDATVNMHVCNPAPLQYDAPAVAMPSMTQAIPAVADETKVRQLPCHPLCAQHTQRTNLPRAASCLSSGLDSPRASLWHRLVSLPASTVVHQCQESVECKKKNPPVWCRLLPVCEGNRPAPSAFPSGRALHRQGTGVARASCACRKRLESTCSASVEQQCRQQRHRRHIVYQAADVGPCLHHEVRSTPRYLISIRIN